MDQADWQKIQAVFHSALELPETEREVFIASELQDEALRQEVRELLAAEQDQTGILHNPAGLSLADSIGAGAQIGNYEIVKEIGVGGMGSVYLAARADGAFDKQVAIKIVNLGMATPQVVSRFQQERAILARLEHPNIAGIIDGGLTEDGRPYVVMEYVDGLPLTRYCDEHKLSIPARLRLFQQICDAVQYAHQSLIVHRDLKPSNILVNEAGVPKLLDFGIAKLLEEEVDPLLTQTGMLLATPAYAAPEQLEGGVITTMTDVYALGVLLYELLTGRRPFEVRRSADEYRALVLREDPPLPSTALTQQPLAEEGEAAEIDPVTIAATRSSDMTRLRSSIRGDLDNICLMAITREPTLRYTTAAALAEDISRHLEGKPVGARAQSLGYRARKFYGRHRVGVVATSVATIAMIAFGFYHANRIAIERDIAVAEQAKTEQVVEFVTGLFEAADPAQARGEDITARELLEAGRHQIEVEMSDRPAVRSTLQRVLGEVYYELDSQETAGQLLAQALATQRELYGEAHLETARTQLILGMQQQSIGDLTPAGESIDQALSVRRALLPENHVDVIEALSAKAYYEETQGHYAEAEQLHLDALAKARSAANNGEGLVVAQQMAKLASLYRLQDRLAEAEGLLRSALSMQDRLYGGAHPESDETKRQLAELLADRRQFDEAHTLFKELIASRVAMLGPNHYETGSAWNSYAHLLSAMGENEAAIDAYNRMLDITRKSYGDTHPSLAAGYNNVAIMERNQENLDAAIEGFELSLAMQDAVGLEADHPNRAYPISGLGRIYLLQRKFAEAAEQLEKALAIRRKNMEEEHILIIEMKGDLGAVYSEMGRYDEAEALLLHTYQHLLDNWPSDDPRIGLVAGRLVRHYQLTDQPDKAANYAANATPQEQDIMLRYY